MKQFNNDYKDFYHFFMEVEFEDLNFFLKIISHFNKYYKFNNGNVFSNLLKKTAFSLGYSISEIILFS